LIGAGSLSKLNCTKHLTGTTILDASRNNIAISSYFVKKKLPLKQCPSLPLIGLFISPFQKLRTVKMEAVR